MHNIMAEFLNGHTYILPAGSWDEAIELARYCIEHGIMDDSNKDKVILYPANQIRCIKIYR